MMPPDAFSPSVLPPEPNVSMRSPCSGAIDADHMQILLKLLKLFKLVIDPCYIHAISGVYPGYIRDSSMSACNPCAFGL